MTRADYWEFVAEARDVFGLTLGEAREFWRDLRDELDERPTVNDLASDEAFSLVEGYFYPFDPDLYVPKEEEPEDEEESDYDDLYPRDERFELEYGDDDIIFNGEEVEVTAELEYEEGGR
jgi:hypothetical protein